MWLDSTERRILELEDRNMDALKRLETLKATAAKNEDLEVRLADNNLCIANTGQMDELVQALQCEQFERSAFTETFVVERVHRTLAQC
ncbi:hypothetical protein NDU88_003839 [Pleurodeles waltl]|uniref:Uncharacterized protein n=1 Tax=Pleurodeles waltl TaxID=8319 RepID=A0AAV7RHC6_PLEWA|nr:hypothetical protein NDU88_003839 [Pleurodeles waltl]